MCDIYDGKCMECKRKVQVHIGGFSAGREQVQVWCPICRSALFAKLAAGLLTPVKLFSHEVAPVDAEGGVIAGVYLLAVADPHDVCLNM